MNGDDAAEGGGSGVDAGRGTDVGDDVGVNVGKGVKVGVGVDVGVGSGGASSAIRSSIALLPQTPHAELAGWTRRDASTRSQSISAPDDGATSMVLPYASSPGRPQW